MSGRGCLSVLCGVAAIATMVVLLLPVSIEAHGYHTTETVSCGMPVSPRQQPAADIDQANAAAYRAGDGQRTNYQGKCADLLDERRAWAIPVGAITFLVALAAAGHIRRITNNDDTDPHAHHFGPVVHALDLPPFAHRLGPR